MYRRFLSLLLSMSFLIFSPASARAQDAPAESELYAKSAVLMDADSGRILYEKNGHEAMANASTTKILTCIVALENCDPASVVTVSKSGVPAEGTSGDARGTTVLSEGSFIWPDAGILQ